MAVEVDARWEPMGAQEYYDYWRAMYSARNNRLLPLYFPLDKQEEDIVIVKLPIVGDENEGEFIISFLFILISLNFIFMFLFVQGYFKLDSYLDPSFMSIIKDPDLWCKEMGKFAHAQKGFNYARAPPLPRSTRVSEPTELTSSRLQFHPTVIVLCCSTFHASHLLSSISSTVLKETAESISVSSTVLKEEENTSLVEGSSGDLEEDRLESAATNLQPGSDTCIAREELLDQKDLVKLQAVIRGHLEAAHASRPKQIR
ncbi:hypothetical protein ZEAMMB73_Zm00001d013167 [Zea mays]|uniref:Uncharacterized protein n=1 Tax=Zea mays TaxID=4577 RepID=A0A1D6GGA9_MAIZE|nr:hypothetical protein ZEAMMB73_Zm00001d013167 [Zea mays]